jgi:type II pantothenate kinase
MIPFARALLQMGTHVVLAANSLPVLNDITAEELRVILALLAETDGVVAEALTLGLVCPLLVASGCPTRLPAPAECGVRGTDTCE